MSESSAPSLEAVSATELLQRLSVEAPELLLAAEEVDQALLARAAELSPLERLEAASRHLAELRRFRPR